MDISFHSWLLVSVRACLIAASSVLKLLVNSDNYQQASFVCVVGM